MMVILKIPIVYLCCVVWWAVRSEPAPPEGAALLVPADPTLPVEPPGHGRRPRRGGRPHGSPRRTSPRTPRTALARAEARR
jgi:hypothetical protein